MHFSSHHEQTRNKKKVKRENKWHFRMCFICVFSSILNDIQKKKEQDIRQFNIFIFRNSVVEIEHTCVYRRCTCSKKIEIALRFVRKYHKKIQKKEEITK